MTNQTANNEWIAQNIFNGKKADGIAYIAFYIVIPITITIINLAHLPKDLSSAAYCYVTILVSALNCIYDAANRWRANERTGKNGKLFFIALSSGIIAAYCAIEIICILATKNTETRLDYIALVYLVAAVIAFIDAIRCLSAEIAWKEIIKLN